MIGKLIFLFKSKINKFVIYRIPQRDKNSLYVRSRDNNDVSSPLSSSRGTAPSIPQRTTNFSDPRIDQRGDVRGDPRSASQYGETSERWSRERFVYKFFCFKFFSNHFFFFSAEKTDTKIIE